MDFYFRQFWTDPRLAYKKRPGVETLSVGSEFIQNIWVPDTFFVNEKQSYFHSATTSNEFIRIHHSGSITRSIRYRPVPPHSGPRHARLSLYLRLRFQVDHHGVLPHEPAVLPHGPPVMSYRN